MKIAHFSDIHFTLPPWQPGLGWGEGKRTMASLSYLLSRRWRFADIASRITTLLSDVDAQQVDHAVCTGDVSGVADGEELRACAELFGSRLAEPTRWTVLPGNHDVYTPRAEAQNRFQQAFGSPALPYCKLLSPTLALLAIETTRVNLWVDSSGLCQTDTLDWLARQLEEHEHHSRTCVIAMHYGLLRKDGSRDSRHHAIRNDRALLDVLAQGRKRPRLVVHGHLHEAFVRPLDNNLLVCAGSATDLRQHCGYYVIDWQADDVCVIERREYEGTHYVTRKKVRWQASQTSPTRWVEAPT